SGLKERGDATDPTEHACKHFSRSIQIASFLRVSQRDESDCVDHNVERRRNVQTSCSKLNRYGLLFLRKRIILFKALFSHSTRSTIQSNPTIETRPEVTVTPFVTPEVSLRKGFLRPNVLNFSSWTKETLGHELGHKVYSITEAAAHGQATSSGYLGDCPNKTPPPPWEKVREVDPL
ncbi:hypothetical protein BaRGS_00027727, partial [Batillaria attramentaria]